MWGFWDKAHWRPTAAIVEGDNFQLNKAGAAYLRYITSQAYLIFKETNSIGDKHSLG